MKIVAAKPMREVTMPTISMTYRASMFVTEIAFRSTGNDKGSVKIVLLKDCTYLHAGAKKDSKMCEVGARADCDGTGGEASVLPTAIMRPVT